MLLALFWLLGGCTWPGYGDAAPPPSAYRPRFTLTPTPLRPLPPSPTYWPTATPTPTPTPLPTATPTPGPPRQAVSPITALEGRINLLLLGSDQRPGRPDFRTDSFIFISYNPRTGSTIMVSFPRDIYVYIPGWGYQRINTAMEFGGFDLVNQTLLFNFGLHADYFVLINFRGFRALVDQLGGVDVYLARRLCDDQRCLGPGQVHLDGATALWYVRSRKTTSDFDRARRQQQVLLAIANKLLTPANLLHLGDLYATFQYLVYTNVTLDDVLALAPQLGKFSTQRIETYVLAPPTYGQPWVTAQRAYVVLPNIPAIQALLREVLTH